MAIAPVIPRSVLADQVKDRILEGILNGYYQPDSRIVETQVARELGTSQAPVREALRGLEALGVVEITPFRGARVRRPSRREIIEAYTVRSTLEALASRLAVPRMTDQDIAELAGYLKAMRAAARNDDGRGVAEADARFHGRIVELAANGTLERVWGTLEPFSRTYITLVVPGADPKWSADLHAPILAAIERRDTEEVVRALQRHFDEVSDNMARRWPDDEEPVAASPARKRRNT
jgi:DNA-binding GntR family transcriptional regulator